MMTIMNLTNYIADADCPELVNAFNGPADINEDYDPDWDELVADDY